MIATKMVTTTIAISLFVLYLATIPCVSGSDDTNDTPVNKLFETCKFSSRGKWDNVMERFPKVTLSRQISEVPPLYLNVSFTDLWISHCNAEMNFKTAPYDKQFLTKQRLTVREIEISYSNISGFKNDFFCDYEKLYDLSLPYNRLNDVSQLGIGLNHDCSSTNCQLSQLTHVDLTGNKFQVIKNYSFCQLKAMKVLQLNGCEISSIEVAAFYHTKLLRDLYLSGNQLKQLPTIMIPETTFFRLYLDNNQLEAFPKFQRYSGLYSISIHNNCITTLKKSDFGNFSAFMINLSHNNISSIDDNAFDNIVELRSLHLNHNQLTTLNEALTNVSIMEIHLNNNRLTHFSIAEMPTSLWHLSLKNNSIGTADFTQLQRIYNANNTHFGNLQRIELDFNKLTSLDQLFLTPSVKHLGLKGNQLHQLTFSPQYQSLFELSKTKWLEIDLSNNNFTIVPPDMPLNNVHYAMKGNPLLCSCENEGRLLNYNIFDNLPQPPCNYSRPKLRYSYRSVRDYWCHTGDFSSFLCLQKIIKDELFICKSVCAFSCRCSVSINFTVFNVDCSNQESNTVYLQMVGLKRFHLSYATLRMDGTYMNFVEKDTFNFYATFSELYLNRSNIAALDPMAFRDLKQLRVLNLDGNHIAKLPDGLFDDQENLEKLYLSNNHLTNINNDLFNKTSRLQILHLHNNHLVDFSFQAVEELKSLRDLTLQDNYFDDCDFNPKLCEYLQNHASIVGNATRLYCSEIKQN